MGQRMTEPGKRGRPPKVGPNKIEQEVIDQIAKEGFQNINELRSGCLNGYHRCHGWRILKQMVQAGILRPSVGDNGGILGWSLQPRFVAKSLDGAAISQERNQRSPVYRTSYSHDVILRQTKQILLNCKAIVKWVPEYVLKVEAMRGTHFLGQHERAERLTLVPDALLHLRCSGVDSKAALELELTLKSRKRLVKKFEAYITSDQFSYAFFIAGTPSLAKKLRQICDEVRATSWRAKIAKTKNGIYFASLDELLKLGIRADFTASHETVRFEQLVP